MGLGVGGELGLGGNMYSNFEDHGATLSRLHGAGLAADLALDQLPGPARRLDRPRHEIAVRLGLLDHNSQPLLAEGLDKLSVGVRVREVTRKC